MRLLIDTHAFLWYLLDDARLGATPKSLISDPDTDVEVSPATLWEIAIKVSLNKYSLPEPLGEFLEREIAANQFRILAIAPRHVAPLASLPFYHRDPFDRLIIAQAIVEDIPVVSRDTSFDDYPVRRLW